MISGAFQNNTEITSVTFIGMYAFSDCTGLKAALFQGNAPANLGDRIFERAAIEFTIFYHEGAIGFTSPKWRGYASMAVPRPGGIRKQAPGAPGGG
ncbi:MAG: hypothetical protein V4726_12545 [Verrucomicrobiota bacterium]